jgi:hypothetical protein
MWCAQSEQLGPVHTYISRYKAWNKTTIHCKYTVMWQVSTMVEKVI